MDLHPNLTPLAALLGTWRGTGQGEYPTIEPFTYGDEWEFSHSGKPFIAFVQRTRSPQGVPMHTESGYLRMPSPGVVEIVVALPMGQVEIGTGTVTDDGSPCTIRTDSDVRVTPSGKRVDRIVRTFTLRGDQLELTLSMDAVGVGLTHHLSSLLRRDDPVPPVAP